MQIVQLKFEDYEVKLKKITDLISDDHSKYVLGKKDDLQIDILVRIVIEDFIKKNDITEPVELILIGLLKIQLNKVKINDMAKYVYAYILI